jgi:hypothetical protein
MFGSMDFNAGIGIVMFMSLAGGFYHLNLAIIAGCRDIGEIPGAAGSGWKATGDRQR